MTNTRFYILGFGVLALFDTATQIFFKLSSRLAGAFSADPHWLLAVAREPWIYGAVAGYIGSFVAWMTVLKHAPVGPAFAASHLSVVLVLAISVAAFGEHLSGMQILGAFAILAGVVFLSLSKAEDA